MKDKKGLTITNPFQKILNESNCKPSKICLDKGSKFYKRSIESFLQNNSIEKNEFYKHMASISKNAYIIKLDDTVNKYMS